MKPALLSRFVRSSRHVDAEPCRNCGTVYFGNFCNECGQEAYTGAPTTLGFIYEFLTRNLFERGKVHRTMWQLVRHPGGLTVDFLEGRRQRFIRPVRLYFILSVMYFLLLSFQNSTMMKIAVEPVPPKAAPPAAAQADVAEPAKPGSKGHVVVAGQQINPNVGKIIEGSQGEREPVFMNFAYEKELAKYTVWQVFKQRVREFIDLPEEKRNDAGNRIALEQAPKAMFFLVPVFALFLKGLFVFRRIPYGAHLLFAFHFHCYVFLMLLLMQIPVPSVFKVFAGLSMPWYLLMAMRTTYQVGWIGGVLRLLALVLLYAVAIAITFMAAVAIGLLMQTGADALASGAQFIGIG
jgi:hypothetical protein